MGTDKKSLNPKGTAPPDSLGDPVLFPLAVPPRMSPGPDGAPAPSRLRRVPELLREPLRRVPFSKPPLTQGSAVAALPQRLPLVIKGSWLGKAETEGIRS